MSYLVAYLCDLGLRAEILRIAVHPLISGKFVSHEYSTMENFCFFLGDKKISSALSRAILGAGVFSRFSNCIHRYGIADGWYKYRYNSMKRIVIDWCEANNIIS